MGGAEPDGGEVGHRPTHPDEDVGHGSGVEPGEIRGHRVHRPLQVGGRHNARQAVGFSEPHRADVEGFLAELGTNQETRQQTKTRTALEYFARRR